MIFSRGEIGGIEEGNLDNLEGFWGVQNCWCKVPIIGWVYLRQQMTQKWIIRESTWNEWDIK